MRAFILTLLALAACPAAPAQPVLSGRVLDPVACAADPTQRYVLYVPSGYSSGKRWPAIFCFDAGARGRMPVERLQAAAERYGYIIAGSLNSRNGPWPANAAAAQAMMKDVSARFSLDSRRIYTTGVSGGARVATTVALSGIAQGVIACAAGFPVLPDGIPDRVPFVFFGTTGTEDFNHSEMVRLDGELESRRTPHRIVIFPGGHEWASADLMTEAVEWLELQAMRAGTKPGDDTFVQAMLRTRLTRLPVPPGLERWRALKSLAADFEGLADVNGFRQAAKELGASRDVKAGLKAERTLAAQEDELLERLDETAFKSAAKRQKLAAELRERAGRPEDTPERQMVRRALAGFTSMAGESVRGLFEEKSYDRAEALLGLAAELKPEQPRTWFDLARAHAYNGDRPGALTALQRAAATGFNGAARLESEPAFAGLRSDPLFQGIIDQVRGRMPEPTPPPAPPAPGPTGTGGADEILQLPVMRVSTGLAHVQVRQCYLANARGDLAGAEPRVLSHLQIEAVQPNTAADRAGLKPSMEITSVQGIRLRGLNDDDLNAVMARPAGSEIVLTVRNPPSDRERELRIPLRQHPESAGHLTSPQTPRGSP